MLHLISYTDKLSFYYGYRTDKYAFIGRKNMFKPRIVNNSDNILLLMIEFYLIQ